MKDNEVNDIEDIEDNEKVNYSEDEDSSIDVTGESLGDDFCGIPLQDLTVEELVMILISRKEDIVIIKRLLTKRLPDLQKLCINITTLLKE